MTRLVSVPSTDRTALHCFGIPWTGEKFAYVLQSMQDVTAWPRPWGMA